MVTRVWAPRGQRPTAWVRPRYQWLYVYAFVRPTMGQTWRCLVPTVSTDAFARALAEFAHDEGIDAAHRAVIALDGAGWHGAAALVIPEGLHLVPLPPASPELQPAERLWPLVDEVIANRTFVDVTELEAVLVTRCRRCGRTGAGSKGTPAITGGPVSGGRGQPGSDYQDSV